MLSRENRVIVGCVLLATVVFVFLQGPYVTPTDWQILAVLIGVGVLLPIVVNNYLDSREVD